MIIYRTTASSVGRRNSEAATTAKGLAKAAAAIMADTRPEGKRERGEPILVRLQSGMLKKLDEQRGDRSRPEAIRRLLEKALT